MLEITSITAGPFQTNTYVVTTDEGSFVIDPGVGTKAAVEKQLNGAELSAVLLTHGHLDHCRDAGEFGVPVYVHEADRQMAHDGSGFIPGTEEQFLLSSMTPPHEVRPLIDGSQIAGFTIRHAPGHTMGSVLLVGEKVVFTGDVLFRGSIGRTDFPHSDPQAMQATLRGPVAELDDGLMVLPGHGPATTMSQEKATNPFL